jgi:hypothetical protein
MTEQLMDEQALPKDLRDRCIFTAQEGLHTNRNIVDPLREYYMGAMMALQKTPDSLYQQLTYVNLRNRYIASMNNSLADAAKFIIFKSDYYSNQDEKQIVSCIASTTLHIESHKRSDELDSLFMSTGMEFRKQKGRVMGFVYLGKLAIADRPSDHLALDRGGTDTPSGMRKYRTGISGYFNDTNQQLVNKISEPGRDQFIEAAKTATAATLINFCFRQEKQAFNDALQKIN